MGLGLRLRVDFSGLQVEGLQLLGGSWVVISGVISPLILLIILLITTHEPPSREPPKE